MTGPYRILTMASGHPDFNVGGSEMAAHALWRAYRASDEVEKAIFVGCHTGPKGPSGRLYPIGEDEYIWEQSVSDWFTMRTANRPSLFRRMTELLRAVNPTHVHLQHYAHVGLDILPVIRAVVPDAKIILTLHEYLAICFNQGQMIKTGSGALCNASGLEPCHRCFPDRSPEEFWLRRDWYHRNFQLVDNFVAPSEFLRGRYVDWGIAPDRITVIENPIAPVALAEAGPLTANRKYNRFGFFGQVTPFKGVDVLLQGVAGLPRKSRARLRVELHGANLDKQTEAFRMRIAELSAPLEKEGVVHWMPPYDAASKSRVFQSADWVVVPSVWWENSPMVIQEAFANGRPVLCSDIGGMAEKVTDGIDGCHIRAGSPAAWGDALDRLAGDEETWRKLQSGIVVSPPPEECARRHLNLFGGAAKAIRRRRAG